LTFPSSCEIVALYKFEMAAGGLEELFQLLLEHLEQNSLSFKADTRISQIGQHLLPFTSSVISNWTTPASFHFLPNSSFANNPNIIRCRRLIWVMQCVAE
jgi:hypothetical protein